MERYPSVVYFVSAQDHEPVFFDGVHALRHAIHFAGLARKKGFVKVQVGVGRGS
jgi:hypothetical protein